MQDIINQQSTPGLVSLVYKGDIEGLTKFLMDYPQDRPLVFAHEPYCNIQGRRKKACLKLLCDDPRLQFDHLFVGRMLYFSTREVHQTILDHPRFKKLMINKKSFMDFFWENFPGGQRTHLGISQRYIQVEHLMLYRKKRNNFRLTFLVYPFLVKVIRAFLERHYAPGEKGYLRSKKQFESLVSQ